MILFFAANIMCQKYFHCNVSRQGCHLSILQKTESSIELKMVWCMKFDELPRFLYTYTYIQGWKSMQFPNSEIIVEFRAKPTVHYFVKTNFPNLSICIMACIKTNLAIFPIQNA